MYALIKQYLFCAVNKGDKRQTLIKYTEKSTINIQESRNYADCMIFVHCCVVFLIQITKQQSCSIFFSGVNL